MKNTFFVLKFEPIF